ncbi:hypothetical protein CA51_41700 [Rosistilla oblonga]|nr:hypothetical protein CA51_41700 [Rosistilla oblonga]
MKPPAMANIPFTQHQDTNSNRDGDSICKMNHARLAKGIF